MLIRISGGRKGIKEYLETGRKQGRRESRAELDERVILAGDLQLADQIIASTRTRGDRYLHITLSFKEDQIDRTVLSAIVADFERFAFSAFGRDEYHYYAEAHLPRIKSVEDKSKVPHAAGTRVERKPHIHIVIPKRNLLSDGYLNPFGVVEKNCQFIDAFQESVNARYGLASPKNNVRQATTGRSDVLSRSKGDQFLPGRRGICSMLANRVISEEVTDWQRFGDMLAEYGDVTVHGGNGRPEYYRLVPHGEDKAIRLKEKVFSRGFIELPMSEKQRRFGRSHPVSAIAPEVNLNVEQLDRRLDEWRSKRSREVKYLNSGNRIRYQAYLAADDLSQRQTLAELEANFYRKHGKRRACTQSLPITKEFEMQENYVQRGKAVTGDNTIAQRFVDRERAQETFMGNHEATIQQIKQHLPAKVLLNSLLQSHGLDLTKYRIDARPGEGDRIIAGNCRYSLNDFLTREMHLPWPEAKAILNEEWSRYQSQQSSRADNYIGPARSVRQTSILPREERRIQGLHLRFERDRQAIIDGNDSAAVRLHHLAVLDMGHMIADQQLRDVIWREKHGNHDHNVKPGTVQIEVVGSGDDLLDWLNGSMPYRISKKSRQALMLATRLEAIANPKGVIDWCERDRCLMQDCGDRVRIIDTSDAVIEVGLRLALTKFGPDLQINGSDAFKKAVARIAAEAGLEVTFNPPEVQVELERLRTQNQAATLFHPSLPNSETKLGSSEQSREQNRKEEKGWER